MGCRRIFNVQSNYETNPRTAKPNQVFDVAIEENNRITKRIHRELELTREVSLSPPIHPFLPLSLSLPSSPERLFPIESRFFNSVSCVVWVIRGVSLA